MKALIVILALSVLILAFVPFGVLNALLVAWVVLKVWPWFFLIPAPPFAAVVGARLLIGLFFNDHPIESNTNTDEALTRLASVLAGAFIGPLAVLGMAWIVHLMVHP